MTRPVPRAQWLTPLGVLWCVALLTDFRFDMFRPENLGQVFNDMLRRLLHLDLTISRDAIGFEVFSHDGHSYTYFGVLPALVRLPVWLLGQLDGVEYGWWSCTIALAIWLWALLRALDEMEARMPPAHRLPLLQWTMRIALLFSGPQIFLLGRASIYNEAVFWASALAALFNILALRAAAGSGRPTPAQLAWLAVLGGLAVHARPSIGIAMCLGVSLLLLREAWFGLRRPDRGAVVRALLPTVGVLAAFGLAAAAINMARWGNPLVFADYHAYENLQHRPGGRELLDRFGELDISRVWYALLYYVTGTAYFLQSVPLFADWIAQRYFLIATPPAAEPLLVPLQLALAWLGLRRIWRVADLPAGGAVTAAFVLVGHAFAGAVVLGYYAVAVRYRADFAPFVMFACLLGYPAAAAGLASSSERARGRWLAAALAAALLGVAVSHYTLVLYKITDRYVPMEIRRAWVPLAPFAAPALSH
jgi:hypothetical protein